MADAAPVVTGVLVGLILLAFVIADVVLFFIWIRWRKSLKQSASAGYHNRVQTPSKRDLMPDVERAKEPITSTITTETVQMTALAASTKPPAVSSPRRVPPTPPMKPEKETSENKTRYNGFAPSSTGQTRYTNGDVTTTGPEDHSSLPAISYEQATLAVVVSKEPEIVEAPHIAGTVTSTVQHSKPEKPSVPVKPVVPVKPAAPVKPAVPIKPTVPEKPIVSAKPVPPEKPGKPPLREKPAAPMKPPIPVKSAAKATKPRILSHPTAVETSEGESVVLEVKFSGTPFPSISWLHEGRKVGGDSSVKLREDHTLFFPCIETRHAGVYSYTVSNPAGSTSGEVRVEVYSVGRGAADELKGAGAVPVDRFKKYVSELHLQNGFQALFETLTSETEGREFTISRTAQNMVRNRFRNITPYDDHRIVLKPFAGYENCSHFYINASYIDGVDQKKSYIATQAPLPTTVTDFWRMVWQEDVQVIAMLVDVSEQGQKTCEQYWPESGSQEYGPFRISLCEESVFPGCYTARVFQVEAMNRQGGVQRKIVTQYHFTSWPAYGVPNPTSFLSFYQNLKQSVSSSSGPTLVHCSAGVGRTGTLISIDIALDQAERERVVNIPGIVTKIRRQRMKMVQKADEFRFIHDAVVQALDGV